MQMNLLTQFCTVFITTPGDLHSGEHVREERFYDSFKQMKDRWMADMLAANQMVDLHFVARTQKVDIWKEVFHPSILRIFIRSVSFEELRLRLVLEMESQDDTCATAEFELIPVDLTQKRIVSKSLLVDQYAPHLHPMPSYCLYM